MKYEKTSDSPHSGYPLIRSKGQLVLVLSIVLYIQEVLAHLYSELLYKLGQDFLDIQYLDCLPYYLNI